MASLYIHIPFCKSKCLFCSFVVSVGREHRVAPYLKSLAVEAKRYQGTFFETVYVGGGTPTFMDESQLAQLMKIIKDNFTFKKDFEFTIEANPENIDFAKAKLLYKSGINRVSLGVQSLND